MAERPDNGPMWTGAAIMNPDTYQFYFNRADHHVRVRVYMDGSTLEDKFFPTWADAFMWVADELRKAQERAEEVA